jgi:hypothetical protein
MKLDKALFEGMIKTARQEQEKAKTAFERQAGVIGFCEYVLEHCDFLDLKSETPEEGVK